MNIRQISPAESANDEYVPLVLERQQIETAIAALIALDLSRGQGHPSITSALSHPYQQPTHDIRYLLGGSPMNHIRKATGTPVASEIQVDLEKGFGFGIRPPARRTS